MREYLKYPHPHVFYVKATFHMIDLSGSRSLEFHDLFDALNHSIHVMQQQQGMLTSFSCEEFARDIAKKFAIVRPEYLDRISSLEITVSEDGLHGATTCFVNEKI